MGSIIIKKKLFDKTLRSTPAPGKSSLEPFKSFAKINNLPLNVVEDVKVINKAEAHRFFNDLVLCLEGTVRFVCGGKLSNPKYKVKKDGKIDKNELLAERIVGGTTIILNPGDWLWIPANTPHQHQCKKVGRLLFIKIPTAPNKK